uniref:Uncharacterized protein n=1 Tax=Erythrolobus australicus TaxID=1077150 RepID=A0A7S1XG37_9RHOD|mmetsp:Transcript_1064/g.3054  ORF Transcript_1064/g.3054 Transcript_1064/m.3054 type:complete len:281 (+) Transcript_1064:201-1043(+)
MSEDGSGHPSSAPSRGQPGTASRRPGDRQRSTNAAAEIETEASRSYSDGAQMQAATSEEVRMPRKYVLKRKRELWTPEERTIFKKGLEQHGRNWKAIREDLGMAKSLDQIRSYAQKYFKRLQERSNADTPASAHVARRSPSDSSGHDVAASSEPHRPAEDFAHDREPNARIWDEVSFLHRSSKQRVERSQRAVAEHHAGLPPIKELLALSEHEKQAVQGSASKESAQRLPSFHELIASQDRSPVQLNWGRTLWCDDALPRRPGHADRRVDSGSDKETKQR